MAKDPGWKQPTPQMQYVAAIMRLDGEVMLVEMALADLKDPLMRARTPRIRECVEELRRLIPFIEGKEKW